MSKRTSNKKIKQIMIDSLNHQHDIKGYKTIETHGWFGWSESGPFHCSGSNFLWVYESFVISILAGGRVYDYTTGELHTMRNKDG